MTAVAAWRKNRTDSSPAAIRKSRHREDRLRVGRSAIRWDRRPLSNQPSVPDHSTPACVCVPEHSSGWPCTAPAPAPTSLGIHAQSLPGSTTCACSRPTGAPLPICQTLENCGAHRPRRPESRLLPRAPVFPAPAGSGRASASCRTIIPVCDGMCCAASTPGNDHHECANAQ
jgi:hypothetical protein